MDKLQSNLRRYLLGDLEGSQADQIGEAIIAGDTLDESLRAAEHDLMEDHLEGSLGPRETELFFENFLVSRERAIELESIRLLRSRASRIKLAGASAGEEDPGGAEQEPGYFDLFSFFRRYWIGFAAGAALVCVALVFVFTSTPNGAGGDLELAELNERDLEDLTQFAEVPKVALTPGRFRNTQTQRLATVGPNGAVMLRLILPTGWGPENRYGTELSRADGAVFRVGDLRAYKTGQVYELRVIVPAPLLGEGEHKATVTLPGPEGGTAEYWFDIP